MNCIAPIFANWQLCLFLLFYSQFIHLIKLKFGIPDIPRNVNIGMIVDDRETVISQKICN